MAAECGKPAKSEIPVGTPMGKPRDSKADSPGGQWDSDLELGPVGASAGDAQVGSQLPPDIRAGFVRKVYGILTAQLAFTVLFVAACMLVRPMRSLILGMFRNIPGMQLLLMVPTVGVICALMKYKDQHPLNYKLLAAFTVLISLPVGYVCAAYYAAGLGFLVLQALLLTMACFSSLTAYAVYSKQDFSWMGGMLSMGLMGMIMWGFLGSLFGFGGGLMYSACGAILFCGYIVFDTHRVMEVYGPDDAIVAAIELYLDVINLFMYLLELLSAMSGSDR